MVDGLLGVGDLGERVILLHEFKKEHELGIVPIHFLEMVDHTVVGLQQRQNQDRVHLKVVT